MSELKISFLDNEQIKSDICNNILRSLPEWFGIEQAIVDYVKDVRNMPTWSAEENAETIAFLSLKIHNEYTTEIHVMGVLKSYHRRGVGQKLIKEAEIYLRKNDYKFLTVKTLSPARVCDEYEKTRKFYLSYGFLPIEEFKTLWGEANPCLMMIKSL
jgi:ribosomal protein S18 acetylase RimI-like enzyme